MSQSTTLSSALTAAQLAAMDGEHIVKMGRELIAQLGDDPDRVHGNIWPGNIHLDEDGKAVLGEGCNAPVSARTPEQIEYMAPEAFWENRFHRDADLYSIALLMYTAYNGGCLPFTKTQAPEDTERAQALRTRMKGGEIPMPSGASEAVTAILRRALNYEATERYATADAMLRALGETDEALPSQAPEEEIVADPQAAAAAAATGMAGVSLVAELAAIPRDQMRPVETQAGVSASSILMEQELHDIDGGKGKTPPGAQPEPLADIFAQPESPVAETEGPPMTEKADAPEREEVPEPIAEEKAAETASDSSAPETLAVAETTPLSDAPAPVDDGPKTPAKPAGKSKKKKSQPKSVAGIVDLPAVPEKEKTTEPETTVLPEAAQETAVLPEKTANPQHKPAQTARKAVPTAKKPAQSTKKPAQKPAQPQGKTPAPVAPQKKQYTVQKDIDHRQETAARRKNRRGAILAIGVGALVIAGLIAVTAYSLGAFEKEQPVTFVTAEPTAETTAAPVATPEQEQSVVTVPEYHFTAVAADFDWEELKNVGLAVLDGQDAFDAAVAAAEEAGLENAWLGARWLDADNAPDGEAGWYWLDDTQLPENSSFWAENEPSTGSGGRLMMCRMTGGNWRLCAVTREQYESGEYEKLGCITDGSGMAAVPSPAPTATPEPTSAPTSAPSSYSAYVPTYTATATAVPSSAPAAADTPLPSATSTPAATTTPEKYLAVAGNSFWTATDNMVVIGSEAEFAAVTEFLDAYNAAHADAPLYNVWLGAQYKQADDGTGLAAGWYWMDGTALSEQDSHWAAEQTGGSGSKLMLRYVDDAWGYYAVSETEYGDGSTFANCGTLKLNPAAQ